MKKNKIYNKIFGIMILSILLIVFIFSTINVLGATNISILYGWNGSENIPINVDASGRLQTTMNLTESTGLFPDIDNLRDLGTGSLRWKSLYVFNLITSGASFVSLNASSLNITGQTLLATASGNVGIGNTIPNNTLDVSGNANISGILHASGVNVSGTVEATTFIGSGSSLTGISSATPVWNSSGTNVYLNDSTGKIGIGTASPNYKLDVVGSINATNINATGIIQATTFIGSGSSLTGLTTGHPWNSSGTTLYLNDSTAKVGIGTTSPATTLDVVGNITFRGNLNVTGSTYFGTQSFTNIDASGNIVGKGNMTINNTVLFVNRDNGRVGIGTTTPLQTLVVVGTVNITDSLNVSGTIEATTFIGDGSSLTGLTTGHPWNSSGTTLYLNDSTAKVGIGTISPTAKLDVNGTGPGNLFRVGNDSNDFIVVNGTTGNVGIGNTIPNNTLDVSGNANISGILHASGVNVSGAVQATTFIGDGSSLTGLTTGHPWNSSGTTLYLNDSTAKVGIGTTGPGEDLEIKSTTPELRFNDSDNSNYFDIGMSGTYFKIYSNDTSASGITVDLSGNVGIGNMIPNASLDVSGNIYLSATNPMINMSGPTIRKSGNDIVISD